MLGRKCQDFHMAIMYTFKCHSCKTLISINLMDLRLLMIATEVTVGDTKVPYFLCSILIKINRKDLGTESIFEIDDVSQQTVAKCMKIDKAKFLLKKNSADIYIGLLTPARDSERFNGHLLKDCRRTQRLLCKTGICRFVQEVYCQ